MPLTTKTTAERIQTAVIRGAYQEVDELLVIYRREVESDWRAAHSAEERGGIASEAMGLLKWARESMLAARSHAQSRLIEISGRISRSNAYAALGRTPDRSKTERLVRRSRLSRI